MASNHSRRISIIVPAYNEERLLRPTLQRIKQASEVFHGRNWETQFIVCDNNSTDGTAEIARSEGFEVVFEPVNQIGRARNTGASIATGQWLIFVDADSLVSPALFSRVALEIASGECIAGGAVIQVDLEGGWAVRLTRTWNWISRRLKWMAGSFIFCEATAFREAGGFDLKLYASEEIELSKKLKRIAKARGKQIVIIGDSALVSSGRKMHLYSTGEHFRFLLRTVLTNGRTLNSREACHTWYDGRR